MSPAAASKKKTHVLATPSGFSKGILGHSLWPLQSEILDSIAHHRRTAVKSCHSSGKTFLAADAVLWWITVHPDGVAITTAPGWMQVEKLLWGEIRKSLPTAKIQYPKPNLTELKLGEGNYAVGISTNESTRFQGFKANHVLIVLDEAPGVLAEVWQAIQGLRAGGEVHVLAIGNPTIIGGEFYDAFTTKRESWKTFTISAFDTPNLNDCYLRYTEGNGQEVQLGTGANNLLDLAEDELDRNVHPYLCTRRWVKEMFTEWGPHHAYFESRVLGDFPTESDDTLIPLSWLEKLRNKEVLQSSGPIRAGLDVAGPGEAETVLTVEQGNRILLIKAWPYPDPRGDVVAALAPYKNDLVSLNVDNIGVGWGIYLHLQDVFGKGIVHGVNVGAEPRDKSKFVNAKAEYYWGLRLRVQAGDLLGLTDEKAIGQLTSIRYKHNARGQIVIESKDELTKRGIKSPDRAESLMLSGAITKRPTTMFAPPVLSKSGRVDANPTLVRPSPWRNL